MEADHGEAVDNAPEIDWLGSWVPTWMLTG